MAGRHYVVPADAQRLAVPVLAHRLILDDGEALDATATLRVRCDAIGIAVDSVPAP